MKIIAATQKGINKTENEDRIIVGKSIIATGMFNTEIADGILAIADGVGGNNAGSTASHFVANKICTLNDITLEQMQKINSDLLTLSEESEYNNGMATTLSGIFFSSDATQLFSVGNTRVYLLLSSKYLKQLTTDDTTLNYLLATGQLSPEDGKKYDRKNEITACFGGGNSKLFKINISTSESLASPIMITSDGIHDYLTVDQMEDIISEYGITEKTCAEMINAARKEGSCDDASILIGGD